MNTQIFEQAKAAYDSGDYQGALSSFTICLKGGGLLPGETGLLYHQIGNCLVKLNNSGEAIQAYAQAAADVAYDALGSVNYNLGMAYASLRDYENAVRCFNASVADAKYPTPYKAYNAMGSALMKLGRSAEAGVAFREAALDDRNTDPTKSLLNLGVCFMALNRASDAVVSYESALQFDMSADVRNRLFANLGQAYAACGQMQKAVSAFEEALADGTYFLSDSASVDYQRAIGAIAQGTSEIMPVVADESGLDVVDADGYFGDGPQDSYGDTGAYYVEDNLEGYYDEDGVWHEAQLGEDRFFTASDAEIEQFGRANTKADRKRRNVGLKVLIAIIIVVVIVFGAGIAAYVMGYGFPTQTQVVTDLFKNPTASTSLFAPALDTAKAKSLSTMVVQDNDVSIDGVNQSMSESTVYATAKTDGGGEVTYKITMVRDLIGWKISNIELWFASQN